jgi:hypothetical protein
MRIVIESGLARSSLSSGLAIVVKHRCSNLRFVNMELERSVHMDAGMQSAVGVPISILDDLRNPTVKALNGP